MTEPVPGDTFAWGTVCAAGAAGAVAVGAAPLVRLFVPEEDCSIPDKASNLA